METMAADRWRKKKSIRMNQSLVSTRTFSFRLLKRSKLFLNRFAFAPPNRFLHLSLSEFTSLSTSDTISNYNGFLIGQFDKDVKCITNVYIYYLR